jgi:hypothetical protein
VAYKTLFLRSTGQFAGAIPHARGTVTEIQDYGGTRIATIDWGDPDIPERVNVANLSAVTVRGLTDE